jgi:hypothetical protein
MVQYLCTDNGAPSTRNSFCNVCVFVLIVFVCNCTQQIHFHLRGHSLQTLAPGSNLTCLQANPTIYVCKHFATCKFISAFSDLHLNCFTGHFECYICNSTLMYAWAHKGLKELIGEELSQQAQFQVVPNSFYHRTFVKGSVDKQTVPNFVQFVVHILLLQTDCCTEYSFWALHRTYYSYPFSDLVGSLHFAIQVSSLDISFAFAYC